MHSTKISGLAVDTEYTFHLVLRTSAGTRHSDRVTVRTHKMTDLSGVTITTGILPTSVKEHLTQAVERIGAKIVDGVSLDTTHFVTTEGRGQAWEKAVEQNIPVVRPEWVDACEKSGRILGVAKFYLDAMRPGPQAEETAATPPVAPRGAPPHPTPAQPASGAPNARQTDKDEQEPEVPRKDGESPAADEEDDETEQKGVAETEQKARAVKPDEQKVRLEDKDIPIRPKQEDDEEEGDSDDQEKSGRDGKDGPKLGTQDGSSFQDISL